jgi:hypothetical protein
MELKLITEEEAKQYIPCKEDFFNRPSVYYTLTPDTKPGREHWEIVTYYTAKKRNEYINREGAGTSWVYILSNPSIPGLYKIGYTKDTPDQRAKEVSRGTGIAMPFVVEWAFQCFDGEMLEHEVHKCLENYRENTRREFFRIDLNEAKKTIEILGKRYTNNLDT